MGGKSRPVCNASTSPVSFVIGTEWHAEPFYHKLGRALAFHCVKFQH